MKKRDRTSILLQVPLITHYPVLDYFILLHKHISFIYKFLYYNTRYNKNTIIIISVLDNIAHVHKLYENRHNK